MKKIVAGVIMAAAIVAFPAIASAHVVVTPGQAAVGDRVVFDVSVPNERQSAVSSVKLDIPKGLQDVQPNVTAGWNITIGTDSGSDVTAITWTGSIPIGQRADLLFKAQVPAKAGELDWKARQTYTDGTVVSWSQKPAASQKDDDSSNAGPYSVTKVVNDLSSTDSTGGGNSSKATLAFVFSVAALALSIGGLFMRRKQAHR